MTELATAPFTFDGWDEDVFAEYEGIRLFRTRIRKTFTGDFVGTSLVEATMATTAVEGSAAYVGIERFEGALGGRAGTFVLHHSASGSEGRQSGSWTIVPDSGTGGLAGISGSAEIVIAEDKAHTLVLHYDLLP